MNKEGKICERDMACPPCVTKKIYKSVVLKAKNASYGSYAAGCRVTYGDSENCYICDYGG